MSGILLVQGFIHPFFSIFLVQKWPSSFMCMPFSYKLVWICTSDPRTRQYLWKCFKALCWTASTRVCRSSFNLSKAPTCVPFAKHSQTHRANDFWLIALSSLATKSFEHLVKSYIVSETQHIMDPLQCAYPASRGVKDAGLISGIVDLHSCRMQQVRAGMWHDDILSRLSLRMCFITFVCFIYQLLHQHLH